MVGGELQGGAHRAVGFGERRAQVLCRGGHGLLGAQPGDDAQHRQAQLLLHVLGGLDGVVQELQQQGQGHAQQQAQEQADGQVAHAIGTVGAAGDLGAVDDGDVVGARVAGGADHLVALQQAVVELAVGVGFAAQDVVLDAAAVGVQRLVAQRGQLALEQLLLGHGRVEFGAHRTPDAGDLGADLPVHFVDLALEPLHVRIVRLEHLQLLLVLALQVGTLAAQGRHQRGGHQVLRQAVVGLQLRPARLGADALGLGFGQGGVDRAQVLPGQRLALTHVDQVFLLRELHQVAFGLLQARLGQVQLFFQITLGVGTGPEGALQLLGDVAVGHRIGRACGELRRRAGEGDVHQPRVQLWLHAQPAHDGAGAGGALGRGHGRVGRLRGGAVLRRARGGGRLQGALEPLQPGRRLQASQRGGVQAQVLGHPFGQAAAGQYADLGGEEVRIPVVGAAELAHLHDRL